ncbi:MAG: tRNA glutamyl-Q(34) synthetase GluQRS [Clostridiales bacterium]|nr:tRNA glutamyl-Q(34) synthetase GluQRS [Clostridiales bacterium]
MVNRMVIGRFAPTPSGFMHAGNLLCAMLAYLSAKSKGGKFIIRIEDLDALRCPRSAAMDIIETLKAVGITSDEPMLWQSERTAAYKAAEQRLKTQTQIYPCYCSRAELHAPEITRLPDGGILYPKTCKSLTAEQKAEREKRVKPSLRISVPDEVVAFIDGICGKQSQNLAESCGDFIIRRSDGVYAYQLAVVVDDGESGVTEVVRGADLLYDTPRQIYLQKLLGLPTPKYYHIPLVCDADGRKLSKSEGDSAQRLLKTHSAKQIIGELAFAANLLNEPRPIDIDDLIPLYSADKIPCDKIMLPESFTACKT